MARRNEPQVASGPAGRLAASRLQMATALESFGVDLDLDLDCQLVYPFCTGRISANQKNSSDVNTFMNSKNNQESMDA